MMATDNKDRPIYRFSLPEADDFMFPEEMTQGMMVMIHSVGTSSLTSVMALTPRTYVPSITPVSKDLAEAREDLLLVRQEADGEGYPLPTNAAFDNAKRLLSDMHRLAPRRYEVYPTPDGEIAIDTTPARGRSLIVLCDSNGEVLWLLYVNGVQKKRRCRSEELTRGVLHDLLSELGNDASA